MPLYYCPDSILATIFRSLKPDGEAVVNFRNFNNHFNRPFYDYYEADGATLAEQRITIGNQPFQLKVLDYNQCGDEKTRVLDRQVYFQGIDDIEWFIRASGFEIVTHEPFHFRSPANPDNEIDVYTIRKSVLGAKSDK